MRRTVPMRAHGIVEVRSEAVMADDQFARTNDARVASGDDAFA